MAMVLMTRSPRSRASRACKRRSQRVAVVLGQHVSEVLIACAMCSHAARGQAHALDLQLVAQLFGLIDHSAWKPALRAQPFAGCLQLHDAPLCRLASIERASKMRLRLGELGLQGPQALLVFVLL